MKAVSVDEQAIIAEYSANISEIKDICQRHSISPSTLDKILKKHAVPRCGPLRRRDRIDWEPIIADYVVMGSSEATARKYGLSGSTLKRELKRRNIQAHRRGTVVRRQLKMPTDLAAIGYLAGLLDGEGTIAKVRTNHNTMARKLSIANTNQDVMEWLGQIGGNTVWAQRDGPPKDGHNRIPCANWSINDAISCHQFLSIVSPYLIIKKAKALAMIAEIEEINPAVKLAPWCIG